MFKKLFFLSSLCVLVVCFSLVSCSKNVDTLVTDKDTNEVFNELQIEYDDNDASKDTTDFSTEFFDNDKQKNINESNEISSESLTLYEGQIIYLHSSISDNPRTFHIISDNTDCVKTEISEITDDGHVFYSIYAQKEGRANVSVGNYKDGVFSPSEVFYVSVSENKIYTSYFSEPSKEAEALEINEGKAYNCKLNVYSDAFLDKDRLKISFENESIASAEIVSASDRGYYTLFNIKVNAQSTGNTSIVVSDIKNDRIIAKLPIIICSDFLSTEITDKNNTEEIGNGLSIIPQQPDNSQSSENSAPGVVSDTQTDTSNEAEKLSEYVLNIKSMKFHYSNCRGAASIKDSNRRDFKGSRSELLSKGYTPCGICIGK